LLTQGACDGGQRSGDRAGGHNNGAGAAATHDDIGVPACDDYLAKYSRCVASHVPDDKKEAFEANLARTRSSWEAFAANPGARAGLDQVCGLALEAARSSMQQYSCTW
jgi:hypothetical protein